MDILILYTKIQECNHKSLIQCNLSLFSKDYQEQLHRYRRWQDAQLSLMGRLLVKEGMIYFNRDINLKKMSFTKYNKPYFKNSEIHFNISHSGEIAAVCMTNKADSIGIDVEKNDLMKIEDFVNQMTKREQKKVFNSDNPLDNFFIYWTQKEAVLKANGNGLSTPLKSFEIEDNKTLVDNKIFYVSQVELKEGYSCHIASQSKIDKKNIIIKKINIDRFITI